MSVPDEVEVNFRNVLCTLN